MTEDIGLFWTIVESPLLVVPSLCSRGLDRSERVVRSRRWPATAVGLKD